MNCDVPIVKVPAPSACAFCLESFIPRQANQRYCSDRCRVKDWAARHPREEARLCLHCGDPVPAHWRFCSPKCRFVHSVMLIRGCAECGRPLVGRAVRFCSSPCRTRNWKRQHPWTGPAPRMPLERLHSTYSAPDRLQPALDHPGITNGLKTLSASGKPTLFIHS